MVFKVRDNPNVFTKQSFKTFRKESQNPKSTPFPTLQSKNKNEKNAKKS